MIYVLMQDASDYGECSKMIFASISKRKVEQKKKELLKYQKTLQKMQEIHRKAMNDFMQENPAPAKPDLVNLPTRPLVWYNGAWRNAYTLEHDQLMFKYNIKLHKIHEELLRSFSQEYDLPEEYLSDLDGIGYSNFENTYSIEEVKSD